MSSLFHFSVSDREAKVLFGIYVLILLYGIVLALEGIDRSIWRASNELDRANRHVEQLRDQNPDDDYELPEWRRGD